MFGAMTPNIQLFNCQEPLFDLAEGKSCGLKFSLICLHPSLVEGKNSPDPLDVLTKSLCVLHCLNDSWVLWELRGRKASCFDVLDDTGQNFGDKSQNRNIWY